MTPHTLRVHGYGCSNITIAISIRDKTKCYQVKGTDPFEDVIRCKIERDLKLSRGHYELFYKHSNTKIKKDVLIETDLDWHSAVLHLNEDTVMFLECSVLPAPIHADAE
ncbi:hypothetical protein CTI12_AA193080 [Artemisia annua]|uniref:Uncharacterized protein n=1 Tax=Artemisia annua TaxID=35608 RepID=A0A2U1MCL8_ARTAN|nr:hypothetical protein CTI12_AA193080 [Artemisia annua]